MSLIIAAIILMIIIIILNWKRIPILKIKGVRTHYYADYKRSRR